MRKVGTVLGCIKVVIYHHVAQENSFCLKVADSSNRYLFFVPQIGKVKIPAEFCYFPRSWNMLLKIM